MLKNPGVKVNQALR